MAYSSVHPSDVKVGSNTDLPLVIPPLPVPNVIRDFDARTLNLTDGAPITTGVWDSLVGGGPLLATSTAVSPLMAHDSNGRPYAAFNSANNHMLYQNLSRTQPHTVVAVAALRETPTTGIKAISGAATDTSSGVLGFTSTAARIYSGTSVDLTTTIPPIGQLFVILGVFNGASSIVRLNSTEATGNAGTNVGTMWSLGRWGTGTWTSMDLYRTAYISGAPDITTRTKIVDFLKARYGIS